MVHLIHRRGRAADLRLWLQIKHHETLATLPTEVTVSGQFPGAAEYLIYGRCPSLDDKQYNGPHSGHFWECILMPWRHR